MPRAQSIGLGEDVETRCISGLYPDTKEKTIESIEKQLVDEAREAASHRKAYLKVCIVCGLNERFAHAYRPDTTFEELGPFKALDEGSIYICSVCLPDLKGAVCN